MIKTIVVYDKTDHFSIHCGKCNNKMLVVNVSGEFIGEVYCTRIEVFCNICKRSAIRKIYWEDNDD